MKGAGIQFPELHNKELMAQLLSEYTYDEIAQLIGCSRAAVYHSVIRHGLRIHTRPDISHPLMQDREFVRQTIQFGPSLPTMEKVFGCTNVTIRNWLRAYGLYDEWLEAGLARLEKQKIETIARRRRVPKYPRLKDFDQLRLDVDERGALAVSKEIGCHVSSVMRALERHGHADFKRHVSGQRPKKRAWIQDRVLILYEAGYSAQEIAVMVGVGYNTTCSWIHDAGISRGPGRRKGIKNNKEAQGAV